MPRGRSTELLKRDHVIRDMVSQGYSRQKIADTFGISLVRVSQINSEQFEDIPDDDHRNWHIAQLEYLIEKNYETVRNPPQAVAPSGKLIFQPLVDAETGEPVIGPHGQHVNDVSRPVLDKRAVAEASKVIISAQERLSKFKALDRPKPKQQDEIPQMEQAMTYVHMVWEKNKELVSRLLQHGDTAAYNLEAEPPPWERDDPDIVYTAEVVNDTLLPGGGTGGFLMRDGTARGRQ